MSRFKITGYYKFFGLNSILEASSQKEALVKMLKKAGIKVNTVTKLTNRVNQAYIDNGVDPSLMIDFVVENLDSDNPIVSTGNWHVD